MKYIWNVDRSKKYAMGYLKDITDHRDKIKNPHSKIITDQLPSIIDLRNFCTAVKDQGELGACAGFSGVALVETYVKKNYKIDTDFSERFLYKASRVIAGIEGDGGSYLRSIMGALIKYGVPHEKIWKYNIEKFDDIPDGFVFGDALEHQAIEYARLDPPNVGGLQILNTVKNCLANGNPAVFGFTVYNSISKAEQTGFVPYPTQYDKVIGGHAVLCVGYDDKKGYFIFKNSWGINWGEKGYGFLPYEYLTNGLASDWWTITKAEFLNEQPFEE